jgi:hypothetical protein
MPIFFIFGNGWAVSNQKKLAQLCRIYGYVPKLLGDLSKTRKITLLCAEDEEINCHRILIKKECLKLVNKKILG